MPKNPDLTILEVTQLNETMKFLEIAKEYSPVGREKLREAMKAAGASFNQKNKRWHIEIENPNSRRKVTDFVTSVKLMTSEHSSKNKKTTPQKKQVAEPLIEDVVTGQTSLNDDYFDIFTVEKKVETKCLAVNIDKELHKKVKMFSTEKEITMSKVIEDIVRDFFKRQKR